MSHRDQSNSKKEMYFKPMCTVKWQSFSPPFWKENQGLSMPSCYNYKRFCCPQPFLLSIAASIRKWNATREEGGRGVGGGAAWRPQRIAESQMASLTSKGQLATRVWKGILIAANLISYNKTNQAEIWNTCQFKDFFFNIRGDTHTCSYKTLDVCKGKLQHF